MTTQTDVVMKTEREVFDIVKAHLLEQKERCTEKGTCMYRGESGKVCAVGALIKDVYHSGVENAAVHILNVNGGVWSARKDLSPLAESRNQALAAMLTSVGVPATDNMRAILVRLQELHDAVPVQHWADELMAEQDKFFPES